VVPQGHGSFAQKKVLIRTAVISTGAQRSGETPVFRLLCHNLQSINNPRPITAHPFEILSSPCKSGKPTHPQQNKPKSPCKNQVELIPLYLLK
jgi:hypothetical protein